MSVAVGILISGTGSNMMALLDAMEAPDSPARPALVASNRPDAPGLAAAAARGVPMAPLDHRAHADRESFDAALDAALRDAGVDLVACAGFMRILTPRMTGPWAGRILNIHPSLLPLFPGTGTHARALAAGVAVHGCTVHELTGELDAGPILAQAVVPVLGDDAVPDLANRVLMMEHRLYPQALLAFARDPGRLRRHRIAMAHDWFSA